MAFEFTREGLSIDTFDEVYTRISDGLKLIYGSEINLDQNTPDGQRVGILVKQILDGQSFAQLLYSQLDIEFSFGEFQDVMFKINGIMRRESSRSYVDVTINTVYSLSIPINYTVQDAVGQRWLTQSPFDLIQGDNKVTLFAEDFGLFSAPANTINSPETIVLGINSVNNPLAAIEGVDEENEQEFRRRRRKSFELAATSGLGRIIASIGELSGVTDVVAYSNNTSVDTTELPANTTWMIVEGGDLAEITETYAKSKSVGTPTKGSINGEWEEAYIRKNGAPFFITHKLNYDRPTEVELYVTVDAKRKGSDSRFMVSPVDTDFIANEIASKLFVISEDVVASELYAFGYQAGTNFILSELLISDDNVTFTDEIIRALLNVKFIINAANVTVTEIIQ